MKKTAIISECGRFRYQLTRQWDDVVRPACFVVTGGIGDVKAARLAMGIDWMVEDELTQAIPPAYTEYVGKQLIRSH